MSYYFLKPRGKLSLSRSVKICRVACGQLSVQHIIDAVLLPRYDTEIQTNRRQDDISFSLTFEHSEGAAYFHRVPALT